VRIVTKSANESSEEKALPGYSEDGFVRYINRDHIIVASVAHDQLTLVMTSGHQLTVRGSTAELTELIDELTRAAQSNFVQISPTS